jgi:hypothetical protein
LRIMEHMRSVIRVAAEPALKHAIAHISPAA